MTHRLTARSQPKVLHTTPIVLASTSMAIESTAEVGAADGWPTSTPETLEKTLTAPEVTVEKPPPTTEVTVE